MVCGCAGTRYSRRSSSSRATGIMVRAVAGFTPPGWRACYSLHRALRWEERSVAQRHTRSLTGCSCVGCEAEFSMSDNGGRRCIVDEFEQASVAVDGAHCALSGRSCCNHLP